MLCVPLHVLLPSPLLASRIRFYLYNLTSTRSKGLKILSVFANCNSWNVLSQLQAILMVGTKRIPSPKQAVLNERYVHLRCLTLKFFAVMYVLIMREAQMIVSRGKTNNNV